MRSHALLFFFLHLISSSKFHFFLTSLFVLTEASIKSTSLSAIDSDESDDYWLTSSSFTKASHIPSSSCIATQEESLIMSCLVRP